MSKNRLTKDQIKCDVLKIKHSLYHENINLNYGDPKKIIHDYLNKVLDKIEEYRY